MNGDGSCSIGRGTGKRHEQPVRPISERGRHGDSHRGCEVETSSGVHRAWGFGLHWHALLPVALISDGSHTACTQGRFPKHDPIQSARQTP